MNGVISKYTLMNGVAWSHTPWDGVTWSHTHKWSHTHEWSNMKAQWFTYFFETEIKFRSELQKGIITEETSFTL